MKILVDTHIALWLFNDYKKLSQVAVDCLRDRKNDIYISVASAWEIAIKHSLGKLPEFDGGVKRFLFAIYNNPIELINIKKLYSTLATLPWHTAFPPLCVGTSLLALRASRVSTALIGEKSPHQCTIARVEYSF